MDGGKKPQGRIKSSIVLRLNTRLFFRLLGIYVGLDLLLSLLFVGGMVFWADRQCADVSLLVEERGVPTAEATRWMEAGKYTVRAGEPEVDGWELPHWLPWAEETAGGRRYLCFGEESFFFGLAKFHGSTGAGYTVVLERSGEPYAVSVGLQGPVTAAVWASRLLLVFQLISLVSNLFRNAGTIRKVLRPIQELAAAAARLNTVSGMSPEELQALTRRVNEIDATDLDTRISVPSQQKELKTLAEAINGMLERINEAYRAQMRFVSDASHELRTPIAVIQGYANMLNRWGKDDPAARQEAIDAISAEAASMKELVEQLLFLARGDNDSMHVEMTDVDLTAVASEVLRETEMIDKTHVFTSRLGGEVLVHADVGLIKQAMRILVDNAIKYTPPEGHIRLSVAAERGSARLTVQDEGQGIDAASLPHIFDRFYRTDQSRARQTGGTGLGLAIAKWIVDRHGGWFEVVSREGVGTRMTVVLPLAQASRAGAPAEKERSA